LTYDSKPKYKKIDEAQTWEEQKDELIKKVVPRLTRRLRNRFNVSMQDVVEMIKARHKTRHRQSTIKDRGPQAQVRESRRMKKNTWLNEVSLF
jgi:hypothetical protein